MARIGRRRGYCPRELLCRDSARPGAHCGRRMGRGNAPLVQAVHSCTFLGACPACKIELSPMPGKLSHYDRAGRARMVDVSGKAASKREAEASAFVAIKPAVLAALPQN